MTPTATDDYWTGQTSDTAAAGAAAGPAPVVHFETLGAVDPLGDQFGVPDPLSVPPALANWLFGQPPGPANTTPPASGPWHSYAILDAAKAVNLAETLATSPLEHDCLYQGAAGNALGGVAPWLVRLEDNTRFTRSLFSSGTSPMDLWEKEAGIFLRSPASRAELVKHFRKFTRLPDARGTRLFLRFWEAGPLGDFFAGNQQPGDLAQALMQAGDKPVMFMGQSDGALWTASLTDGTAHMQRKPLALTDTDKALFSKRVRARFAAELKSKVGARAAKKGYTFSDAELDAEAGRTTEFVFWQSGPESATLQDAAKLMFVLLFLGPEGGQVVLDGPVLQNHNLTMGQRIDMMARSYTTALRRMATGKAF